MPKLKFFVIALPVISLLHFAEYHLLRETRNFTPLQKQAVVIDQTESNGSYLPDEAITLADLQEPRDEKITWRMLGNIKYIEKKTRDYPEGVMYPVINPALKSRKGTRVAVAGYIIPIDEKSFAVSKNVMSACFFCGMAGPETIMGIKFKGKTPQLRTDQYVTLSGTFNLNETNPDDWIYHIENAIITAGM